MKTFLLILAFQSLKIPSPSSIPPVELNINPGYGNFEITAFSECAKFVYIGTNNGVIKKNKITNKISHITRDNSKLPCNTITSLACLQNGLTYMGTPEGIVLWDEFTNILITTRNSTIPENDITALFIDHHEILWIGTRNHGVVKGIGKGEKPYKTIPFLTSDIHIYSIYVDLNDRVWVSYENGGFDCLESNQSTLYPPEQNIEQIKSFPADPFLLNIHLKGTYLYDGSAFRLLADNKFKIQKSCYYHNKREGKVMVCSKEGINVYSSNQPNNKCKHIKYSNFLQSIWDQAHIDIREKSRLKKR